VQRGEIALPCNMQRRRDCSVRVPPYVYGALYAFIFYPIAIAARCVSLALLLSLSLSLFPPLGIAQARGSPETLGQLRVSARVRFEPRERDRARRIRASLHVRAMPR